jgi:hypothetical protein
MQSENYEDDQMVWLDAMPTTVEEILREIENINLDGISKTDKARLYSELLKKFGLESATNVQTLGGSQMIGNTIQFNICDRNALPELIDTLVDKLGRVEVIDIIRRLVEKI